MTQRERPANWYLIKGVAKYWDGESWYEDEWSEPEGLYELGNCVMYWDGKSWLTDEASKARDVFNELSSNSDFFQKTAQKDLENWRRLTDIKYRKKIRRREIIASGILWYGSISLIVAVLTDNIELSDGIITFIASIFIALLVKPRN